MNDDERPDVYYKRLRRATADAHPCKERTDLHEQFDGEGPPCGKAPRLKIWTADEGEEGAAYLCDDHGSRSRRPVGWIWKGIE